MHSDSGCVVVVESESEYDVCCVLLATATESLVALLIVLINTAGGCLICLLHFSTLLFITTIEQGFSLSCARDPGLPVCCQVLVPAQWTDVHRTHSLIFVG